MQDLIGKKYGKLTVLELHHKKQMYLSNGKKNGYNYFYVCKCDCGNKIIVRKSHLISEHTRSCGCLTKKHNMSDTRIFKIWTGMLGRCYNSTNPNYKNYGLRNIKVCKEWQEDFKNFYNWALKNNYNDTLTIDRINVNGNYEPNNCRWVTYKIQNNNRRNNRLIIFNNEIHTLSEWADIYNINYMTLKSRLSYGWDIKRALTVEVQSANSHRTNNS